jgi:hypothetical protein
MKKKTFNFRILDEERKSAPSDRLPALVKVCAYQRDIPHPCGFSHNDIAETAKSIVQRA